MPSLSVKPLQDDLSFGTRISGVTAAMLDDTDVRAELNELFETRGLIVFEDVEPTQTMHVALSTVFGPLKDHPVAAVTLVDEDHLPGVIDMVHDPDDPGIGIVEINGRRLSQWLPWHFDHCYNNELNRAGILRALEVPSRGGQTGFLDGIDLYQSFDPALLRRMEELRIIYTLDLAYARSRFALPEGFREIKAQPGVDETYRLSKQRPRAIHPALWTRASGEQVVHVSPWMAVGVEGQENPAGDRLLEEIFAELEAKARPYFHQWRLTDMLIWDNWRMLHSVSGHDPAERRRMQRTTIKGDYGLGVFEGGAHDETLQHITV